MSPARHIAAVLGLLSLAAPAAAQGVIIDAPGLIPGKGPARAPDVKAPAAVWPRLDRGTILCRTEGDFDRLAANRSGGPGGGPVDCRVIREPTAVTIVRRNGGRSMVQVTGKPNAGGWVDIWLPTKAPAGR